MPTNLTETEARRYFYSLSNNSTKGEVTELIYSGDNASIVKRTLPLTLIDCELKSLEIHRFTGINLLLKNCVIGELKITDFSDTHTIKIEDCRIIKLEISAKANQPTEIELTGNNARMESVFVHSSSDTILEINALKFDSGRFRRVKISAVSVEQIYLIGVEIGIHFTSSLITKQFLIESCYNSAIGIDDGKVQILVLKSSRDMGVEIHGLATVEGIFFEGTSFIWIKVGGMKGGILSIVSSEVGMLTFSEPTDTDFELRKSKIRDLMELASCRPPRAFRVDESKIGKLLVRACNFDKGAEMDNVIMGDSFQILHSNLGSITLNNIHLTRQCTVRIIDSKVTDVAFSGFNWNNDYRLLEDDFEKTSYNSLDTYLVAVRESYRQLKAAYIKGNNRIEALEFQKHELNVHYRILKLRKFRSLRDFGNFLIVGSNRTFSDFGQNIWKPLLYLFIVHLLLFNILLLSNSNVGLFPSFQLPIDWEATSKGVSLYFQTLIPTHHHLVRSYSDQDISVAGFWDFMMRICAGYFIFYFITASRKYHQS